MTTVLKHKISKINYSRISEWGKLIAITGSSQILIQALGFISGILVIRVLPVHEYALYTLANTMLGTLTILADGGISTGTMALGGKVWNDRDKLGKVMATGMALRKKFAIGSLLVSTPVLIFLLRHHEASWLMTALIVLSLIPAFFSALSGTILQIPLKLKQDIRPLQKNQVGVNLARLGMLSLTIFIFPWAFIAILAAGIPQVWANMQLRKLSLPFANWNHSPDKEVRDEMLRFVKRILPGALYYCLSGQITIWLISIFGTTGDVAGLGALGRISMALSIFSILFATLITPRFARNQMGNFSLFKIFIQIHLSLIVIFLFIVFLTYNFPNEILWALGKDYQNLQTELVLSIIGACVNLIAGLSYNLSASKGFILNPMVSIPVSIFSILIAAFAIDISSLNGILTFNILLASVQLLMNAFFGGIRILKES